MPHAALCPTAPKTAHHGDGPAASASGFWKVLRLYPERGVGVGAMTHSTPGFDFEPLFGLVVRSS